jgi:hypothetical protein
VKRNDQQDTHQVNEGCKEGRRQAGRREAGPPGGSRSKDRRYHDIHEDDQLDEAQLAAWVKQSSQLPGEQM